MAEDSSFEGWTTAPQLPPGVMDFPEGRKLPSPPAKGYLGSMRNGVEADAETISFASQQWPQRELDDFVIERRVWIERATGQEYRLVPGNPLLALGHDGDRSKVDAFIVAGGQLWFLRRAGSDSRSVTVGSIGVGGLSR
jgi:hypothetical protein